MKKLFTVLVALALIGFPFQGLRAEMETAPKTGEGVNLTDFNYVGADYVMVESSLTWTTVCSGDGILYDAYAVNISTNDTGDCYVILGSLTSTTTTFTLHNEGAETNGNLELIDACPLVYPLRFKVGMRAKMNGSTSDFLIVYRKTRY